jgi:hypothetical protein
MTRRLLIGSLVFAVGGLWAAGNAFDGTWKFNAAKSKSTGPAWKSRTLTITTDGETRKFKSEGVTADGQQRSGGYEAKADGKDYPMTGNLGNADSISLKEQSPRVMMFTLKAGGKMFSSGRSTVSADGKTLTVTSKGTTADGRPFTSTAVYDKQ